MKKQLKDLNINIPVIDVLESRKLFGGNGGYGDPPGSNPASGDPSHPYVGEPSGSDPDRYPNTDDELRGRLLDDTWNGVGGSGSLGDHDKEGGDDHNNGKSDYNPDDDRQDDNGNDNDANDHREDNSDWDQDHANNQPNGGGTGNSGANGGTGDVIGNPHNLGDHLWAAVEQDDNNCVIYTINGVLVYFHATLGAPQTASDMKATKDYLTSQHPSLTTAVIDSGLNSGQTLIAIQTFFTYNSLDAYKSDQIINALDTNKNPVLAGITINGIGNHYVVIIGHDEDGNFKFFDPNIGRTCWSNNADVYPNGVQMLWAEEITGLNRDYLETVERAREEQDKGEKRDNDGTDETHYN